MRLAIATLFVAISAIPAAAQISQASAEAAIDATTVLTLGAGCAMRFERRQAEVFTAFDRRPEVAAILRDHAQFMKESWDMANTQQKRELCDFARAKARSLDITLRR
ncbi:hypothetical protein E8L99_16475 [Phreatobacter aquaticus]|uniref:Uncharacterized protein n=1 Tax=Phreatobacter aquaticus TaxID=2570229 RepID=A0A4D7QQR0_9HYPH|nr:hypothetical protein [Phreatobacter aquaticus]QCK87237.1 hypothetical protein E8L99_16475 [Phreatobacter aquaticus]